jgi:PhoPQ-activated pathogenicity-related protein
MVLRGVPLRSACLFALQDYTDLNFTRCLDDDNTASLMDIVDPYQYSDKLVVY